jgi:hypothetical protein
MVEKLPIDAGDVEVLSFVGMFVVLTDFMAGYFPRSPGGKRMSKHNLEINYLVPGFDISGEEHLKIIEEADRVIAETTETPERTVEAYLKKSVLIRQYCLLFQIRKFMR